MSNEEKKRDIGKQIREEAFSIPNLLSYFRLLLIPVFIVLYVHEEFTAALITLAVSGLSDILDGRIARKYNMVTDLGKVLDPLSDKVTHIALLICLVSRYRFVWVVLGLLVVKELAVAGLGACAVKRGKSVAGAKWYGKLSTVVFEVVMVALMLFPAIPARAAFWMLVAVCAVMAFAMVMYIIFFIGWISHGPEADT